MKCCASWHRLCAVPHCALLLYCYTSISVMLVRHGDAYDVFSEVYHPAWKGTLLQDQDDRMPTIRRRYYRSMRRTRFTGAYNGSLLTSQEVKGEDDMDAATESRFMSYETLGTRSGRRKVTYVDVVKPQRRTVTPNYYTPSWMKKRRRRREVTHGRRTRREVYGRDNRLFIPFKNVGLKEPYLYTVKISTGCTGILVSPRHVLTAAHCIHDQKDYVELVKNLKTGFMQPNGSIHWIKVNKIRVSNGWIEGGQMQGPFYDYALLRLAKKHNRPYIQLSISEHVTRGVGERIYFTSFEEDKPDNTLWYRSCNVVEDDNNFLYHYCDARPGSSGSGVYSWWYDKERQTWDQELVGVFSGNRWRTYDEYHLMAKNFNVAVRLTAAKYAQICQWMGRIGQHVCTQLKKKRKT